MISICIPVYNSHVSPLAQELSRQLESLNRGGEIIIFDDCSSLYFRNINSTVAALASVRYKELDQNVGRLAIRKLLAETARYEWLIFLDGDSCIDDFHLSRYISILQDNVIFVGGRNYSREPLECNKKLHWNYGVERESLRGKTKAFHSNNFCVPKAIFLQLEFPDQLKGYGHEDTWMHIQFERSGRKIVFVNNPVIHESVEDTNVFLEKARAALQNLLALEKLVEGPLLSRYVRLYKAFKLLERYRLLKIFRLSYKMISRKIEKNLHSCKPSLLLFDMYRLFHFIVAKRRAYQSD